MSQISSWIRKAKTLFQSNKLSAELHEELQFHLDMRTQRYIAEGMAQPEAEYAARRRFGNPTTLRERMREVDFFTLPGSIHQDLRYGTRMLAKHPGFTITAILALALGIGVNTATFTAYKAIVARTIDARDPASIVNLSLIQQSGNSDPNFSYPDYLAYRDSTDSFSGVIAASLEKATLSAAGGAVSQTHSAIGTLATSFGLSIPSLSTGNTEFTSVASVSENYFSVLCTTALRGRLFNPKDTIQLTASPSVLISENYWQRRFSGDPAILGKSVRINGAAFTIIGITQHNFVGTGLASPDFWIPLTLMPLLHPDTDLLHDRENQCCRLFARLATGVTLAQAQAELTLLSNHLRTLHDSQSEASKPNSIQVWPGSPFGRKMDSGLRFAVLLIMVAVGMVLVIACANVASLQLARAASRQNELSMRLSLGATRSRLIRQLLTESALLGLISGTVALAFTWGLLHMLATELSTALPPEWGFYVMHVTPDLQVFAYVFSLSLFAAILFGLAPALESSRSALSSSLKASKESFPARSNRLRDILIAAQVAVCLVLMIAGSLLIRGSINAVKMSTGYDSKHLLDMEITFPSLKKYDTDRQLSLIREIRTRIAALPGVAATTVARPPDGGGVRTANVFFSTQGSSATNSQQAAYYSYVLPNYFATLSIPLLSGRSFQPQQGTPEPSIVLSESAAAQLWPGLNPLGRKLTLNTTSQFHTKTELLPDGVSYQVIGVARDTRGVQLDGSDTAQVYLQLPEDRLYEHPLLIRTATDPTNVAASIGQVIASVDPNLVAYTSTLDQMLRETAPFVVSRCAAAFATIIGIFGLLLSSMGIYGTVSYVVVLRTREVGIRMALGATKRSVLTLILSQSTRPVVAGLAIGITLSIGTSQILHTLLYGLGRIDLLSFTGVSLLFLAIALFAAYMPSRTATRVDPVIALRYE